MIRALNYNAVIINHDPFLRRVVGRLWNKHRCVRIAYGDKEDALQAARLELVRAAKMYDYGGTANFETYAGKYIRRGLLREARKDKEAPLTNVRFDLAEDDQDDVVDAVQWAIEKLSQKDQEILSRRFGMHGRDATPAEDLAELLGVGTRTAQKQLNGALERLKSILERGA